ncbi:hypothetical protein CO540_06655 [Micromonospora sp. WMMA2032]|uniref:hypothetical protein n=1 Tax=Micromonospora sp. WMMA2032 TaxID=2039870 RepID=UPI000C05AA88|nr:hypothetical protein [Micromonospora sp. WMMA2032]ATO13557.1 hypothetical protein CO540_06655 [Micromonospora sp. WMMA2032]
MTRTTPPRPVDVAALFPELAAHSTTATRLHPRPGRPTVADSSVGGPLLWPAHEAWPVCDDGEAHYVFRLRTPASVHRDRAILATDEVTDDQRAQLSPPGFSEPHHLVDQPIPMVPVAQLHRRDVPDFVGPDGTDVMQVLWCPLDHPELGHNPRVRLYWRRADDVTEPLAAAPEPPVVSASYLPTPCVLHPERIREYQYGGLLPEDLDGRIRDWEDEDEDTYQTDLSLAPGWKVGGFANWSLTDPHPVDCAECGTPMTLLFTADSSEWYGTDGSWRPVEDLPGASARPTEVTIGRGYSLYVFRCPTSFDHPPATTMQ